MAAGARKQSYIGADIGASCSGGGTEINRELQSQRSERAQLVLQCSQAAEPLCGTGMCRACLFLG